MKIIIEILRARRKTLLLLAVLTAVTVILFGYYFLRQRPDVDRARTKLVEKSRLLADVGTSGQVSLYAQGQTDLATFRAGIPPKKDFAKTIGEIYQTASRNGLSVGGTTFKPVASGEGGFVSYALSMSVKGKYSGTKQFLAELQALPQSIVVEKVSLRDSSGKGEEGLVNLQLDLTLFLQKEGQ